MAKETFIIRTEWWDAISLLKDKEKSIILNNLFQFHLENYEKIILNTPSLVLIWKLIEPNLKRNVEAYDKRCETSAENGKKGGRPPKETKPKKPKQTYPKPIETLSDTDSVSDTDTDSEIDVDNEEKIQPPFLESKKHLIPEMANKFKDINSNYAFDEIMDYPAIKLFAEFIANRQNKSRVISDLNLGQIDNIVNEFGKIANWYKNTNCTKSLETLAKFEIQKIFNELAQSGQVGGGIKLTTNISLT